MSINKGTNGDGFSDKWIKNTNKWWLLSNLWNDNIIKL